MECVGRPIRASHSSLVSSNRELAFAVTSARTSARTRATTTAGSVLVVR